MVSDAESIEVGPSAKTWVVQAEFDAVRFFVAIRTTFEGEKGSLPNMYDLMLEDSSGKMKLLEAFRHGKTAVTVRQDDVQKGWGVRTSKLEWVFEPGAFSTGSPGARMRVDLHAKPLSHNKQIL